MRASEHPGVMLLAVLLDGGPHTGPEERCGFPLCGRFKVAFTASAGLRAIRPDLPVTEHVCVNGDMPCPLALKAVPWLDALREVTR